MRMRFEYGKLSEVTRHDLMRVHLEEAENSETKTKVGGSSRRVIYSMSRRSKSELRSEQISL